MHTDPIADMLTRIRNAQAVKKLEVILPYSKIKHEIAKIMAQEKWVGNVKVIGEEAAKKTGKNDEKKEKHFKQLLIELLYDNSQSKITGLKRISTPGRRIYVSKDKIPVVQNNYGLAIISTSHGLMTNKEARKIGVGGEVICEIY